MDFDIHRLDDLEFDSEDMEVELELFRKAVRERFAESPEGKARLEADPDMGFWADALMNFGYQYEGAALGRMTVDEVRRIVTEIFPRKISILSPEQADDAIPELTAFWKFLKREYQIFQADAVLDFLRDVEPEFSDLMNDPANFGMAKSMFMSGQVAGFDMTTEEGMRAYMAAYNAGLGGVRLSSEPSPPPEQAWRLDPAERKAERKRRKRVEEARKRERKGRK